MSDVDEQASRRILIVRLGAVGDVVRTLPLLHALRAAHPAASIGWVVEEASEPLLRAMRALDAVHVLRRREVASALASPVRWPAAARLLAGLRRELREARYDLALDVHGTFKAAVVACLPGCRVVGFAPGGSKELAHLLHDVSHPFTALPTPRVTRALMLAAAEGLLGPDPPLGHDDDPRTDFGLRDASSPARDRESVVLFPFASKGRDDKRWPIDRHVELGRRLADAGRERVVLAWGSPREGAEARAALERSGSTRIELAPPTDLVQLAELLGRARLVVAGDTGPMHLAAAAGSRVVALFGPTDPAINRPWGRGHEVLVHRPLSELPVSTVEAAARRSLRDAT